MFFVVCPRCGDAVEVAGATVGCDRTDLWNITQCD